MKIWLDDVREAPSGWTWVRYAEYAIPLLDRTWRCVEHLSLDHDLTLPLTGYDVVTWIENEVAGGRAMPFQITIHSQNPVGCRNMAAGLHSIEQLNRLTAK
jgi:hypothetical protein